MEQKLAIFAVRIAHTFLPHVTCDIMKTRGLLMNLELYTVLSNVNKKKLPFSPACYWREWGRWTLKQVLMNNIATNQPLNDRKELLALIKKFFFLKFILPIFKYMEPSVKNLLFARKRQVVS